MSLRLKLILVSVLLIVTTVAVSGFLVYRESKWKIKELARELVISKTEQAFALCDRHYKNSLEPSEELKREIAALKIAENGYVSVISDDGPLKGVLIVHPTDIGKSLYNEQFAHIKAIVDEIAENDQVMGYSNFTYYRQGTAAKGRQGEKKIGYFKYFAPWNWIILATGYESDVFASRDQLRYSLFQLVPPVIILGVVFVYLMIGHFFKPIQHMTAITKEVAQGNWNISIDYSRNDEVGTLARSFNQMIRSLRENAHIWHEFQIARDMQAQMLPEKYPAIKGIVLGATSIPTKEVGGDFYDFLTLADGRLGIVVGDVSGHGVSAAMVMTAAMSAVRFAAEEKQATDDVMKMVNSRLNKDIQSHMFVALFYGIFDPKSCKFHYTNAGQTMPYILRNGTVKFLPQAQDSDRFPLGIVNRASYEQLSITLEAGDRLVFYTDGIVDAMNGTEESYGFDRLSEAIKLNGSASPSEMVDHLVNGMRIYSGKSSVHDDVTVVILQVT